MSGLDIVIDKEFHALIPPLQPEELAQLEANILADGCRDPLVVWGNVLVDGHNRYEICTRHGLPFDVVQVDFADRDEAMDWMDANQLGRRNITPDQFTLLLGRRYNRAKKAAGAQAGNSNAEKQKDQIDPVVSTAEKLAAEHGVSPATVKRAGQYADAVAKVSQAVKTPIAAPLEAAIKAAGGTSALATVVGLGQSAISNWRARGTAPDPSYCPAIERATGVSVEELRPDVCWHRVPDPDWPNPAGRPLIDVALAATGV